MSPGATLVLVTSSYPFEAHAEHAFLDPELPHLAAAFDRVILAPRWLVAGARRPVSDRVEVDFSLGAPPGIHQWAGTKDKLLSPLSARAWREILTLPTGTLGFATVRRAVDSIAEAEKTRRWASRILRGGKGKSTVFYTYWFNEATLGLIWARANGLQFRLVSRAHGYDVYEDRHEPAVIPFRRSMIRGVEHLYVVSEHARGYISELYPEAAARLSVARLGVATPTFRAPASSDGVLRVASCSFVRPVKRIDLLLKSVVKLAQESRQQVEWTHLGGGAGLEAVAEYARAGPPNLRCDFRGDVPNSEVLEFYRRNPVDVFANTSASEGVPVSIMEALACGIPVVATGVGGTPELVGPHNGCLLRMNAEPTEIAAALRSVAARREMREAALESCLEKFSADLNFAAFAGELRHLVEPSHA